MPVYRSTGRTALYRFYDEDSVLLYVGVSLNIPARMAQHAKAEWFLSITNVDVTWFETGPTALAAERRAICEEKPYFNKRSKRPSIIKIRTFEKWMNQHDLTSIWATIFDWREDPERYLVGWVDLTDNDIASINSMKLYDVQRYLNWLNEKGIISGYLKNAELGFMLDEPEFDPWEEIVTQ